MWVFYFFAALLIWQGLISLRGGARYLAYVRREMRRGRSDFTPYASVIVPCRGLDQDLRANLSALFQQDYSAYELVFVTGSADDLSLAVIEEVRAAHAARADANAIASRLHIAGSASACGQKVHNLRAAVQFANHASEVFVFVDTDARVRPDWLRSLVAPLADESVGAATGYRWFVPVKGGLASHLRSVWNASIASALGEHERRNFCWGGSSAIRRRTFDQLDMLAKWRGTLSDDFALTRALQRAQMPIHFVPNCLLASFEDCTLNELLEFTTRQMKITRIYAPHLWQIVLASNLLFIVIFYGGLAHILARAWRGQTFALPLALLVVIFILGACKALLRLRAVSLPLASSEKSASGISAWIAHLCLWPLTSALYFFNALAAAFSRRITWRGITYQLKSPSETVIIAGVPSAEETMKAHHV